VLKVKPTSNVNDNCPAIGLVYGQTAFQFEGDVER
jgi:hypothetical protein